MDVNHPGATENVFSSIAAAVGSYDEMFTKYVASISVQKKARDEMIDNVDTMIGELMEGYRKANGGYPENVFIFRDGVSEGQFDQIKTKECPKILETLKKCSTNRKINLTVLIVQKRHNTRFVRQEPVTKHNGKHTYNVPSGTVVDTAILDTNYPSFYLNSHFSPMVIIFYSVYPKACYSALRELLKSFIPILGYFEAHKVCHSARRPSSFHRHDAESLLLCLSQFSSHRKGDRNSHSC